METIGKNKEFAKALYHDWTPEKVHHLIGVVDSFVAAALAKQAEAAPVGARPDYTEMSREQGEKGSDHER